MESSQTARSQHHPQWSENWCRYRMTTSLNRHYGSYRPSWLKRISIILLLQSQLFNTGIWRRRHRNLENPGDQRSAHCLCTEQPLSSPAPSAQQSTAESNHDTLILSEIGFLPHTSLQRGQEPGTSISHSHHFPDFAILSFWLYHVIFKTCV